VTVTVTEVGVVDARYGFSHPSSSYNAFITNFLSVFSVSSQ